MKRSFRLLFILLCLTGISRGADLGASVRAILHEPFLAHARWSVKIAELSDDGHPADLFESNATSPMVPASNLKLITTSAAMSRLGVGFNFRTLLVQHGPDLILIGDGDPSFGDAELLKKVGWDVDTVFETWSSALAK